MLVNLDHRGACGCEANTGDGAGILMQMPHGFCKRSRAPPGSNLPGPASTASAWSSRRRTHARAEASARNFEQIVAEEGQRVLGWRDIPTDNSSLGKTARRRASRSCARSSSSAAQNCADDQAFERKLYVIRKRAHNAKSAPPESTTSGTVRASPAGPSSTKACSCRSRSEQYFPDLSDPDIDTRAGAGAFALLARTPSRVGSGRIRTATSPTTARSTRCAATSTGCTRGRRCSRANCSATTSRRSCRSSTPNGSDSAMFDNVPRTARHGRAFAAARDDDDDSRAVERSRVDERREEGVLRIPFVPDGAVGRPGFDRLHRWHDDRRDARSQRSAPLPLLRHQGRPGDHGVRSRRAASRAGARRQQRPPAAGPHVPRRHARKAASSPTRRSRTRSPRNIRTGSGSTSTWSSWRRSRTRRKCPSRITRPCSSASRRSATRSKICGCSCCRWRATASKRSARWAPTRRWPCSRDKPKLLYNYFKQLFAQVTNPPIDCIREEIVTSAETTIGAERNLLKPEPESCHLIELKTPILTNEEFAKLKHVAEGEFKSVTLPILFQPEGRRRRAWKRRWTKSAPQADSAIAAGMNILILSDRGVNRDNAAIPALLAVAGLHHHLIREGTRTRVGLVLESGEPREVHHFCVAHRLRLRRDQSVPRLRDARRHDPPGPARGRRPQDRLQELRQGGDQGRRQGRVEDGHLHDSELSRRADFRSDRPEPGGHGQILHLDGLAHRRRRPGRDRPGSADAAQPRVPRPRRSTATRSKSAASISGARRARRTCSIRRRSTRCRRRCARAVTRRSSNIRSW